MDSDQERLLTIMICAAAMIATHQFIGFQAAVVLGFILTVGGLLEIWAAVRDVEREVWAAGETLRESQNNE